MRQSFDEAAATGAVLLIDEIDTFVSDRADAMRSWEISATNELLACLDGFEGLVVGTTNRMTTLDPAALRRFTWKVAFHLPTAEQRDAMWQELCRHCGVRNAGELPSDLDGLTPSDVSLACARYRGEDAAGLIALLRSELASRAGTRRPIGFR